MRVEFAVENPLPGCPASERVSSRRTATLRWGMVVASSAGGQQLLAKLIEALGMTVAAVFSDEGSQSLFCYADEERQIVRIGSRRGTGDETYLERLVPHSEGKSLNANLHVVPPAAARTARSSMQARKSASSSAASWNLPWTARRRFWEPERPFSFPRFCPTATGMSVARRRGSSGQTRHLTDGRASTSGRRPTERFQTC